MYAFLMPKKRTKKAGALLFSGFLYIPLVKTEGTLWDPNGIPFPQSSPMFFSLLILRQKRKEPKEKAALCSRINSLVK